MKIRIIGAVLTVLLMGVLLPGCSSAQINELEAQVSELEAQVSELEAQVSELKAQATELKSEIEVKNKRISARNKRLSELGKEAIELQKEIDDLKESASETAREIAKIEITFDRDPVPCEDGYWSWRVILTEVNGIGVKLDNLIYDRYSYDDALIDRRSYDSTWLEAWVPSAYLSPYGLESTRFLSYISEPTYAVITVIGIDDNGHKITAEASVAFQK